MDDSKALASACKLIEDVCGTCPYDMYGFKPMWCEDDCGDVHVRECWEDYFRKGDGNEQH